MKHRRNFPIDLKRQVVEELLSGISTPAQLIRRYEISSGLLYHWKEQYARGRFNNEPTKEAALEDRVRQLEQLEEDRGHSISPLVNTSASTCN